MTTWPDVRHRHGLVSRIKARVAKISLYHELMDITLLHDLFVVRESTLLNELSSLMSSVGQQGVFDLWMKQHSDLVQSTAESYAEREVIAACIREAERASPSVSRILKYIIMLYALVKLQGNLGWFLANSILQPAAGIEVPVAIRKLCSLLAPHSQSLVNSFGIPAHLVAAPIASDWESFNLIDNKGEIVGDHW